MLLVVILGAIALVAMRIAGVGNLAKKKPPTPNVAARRASQLQLQTAEAGICVRQSAGLTFSLLAFLP